MKKILISLLSALFVMATYADEPRLSIWGSYSLGKGVSEAASDESTSFFFKGIETGGRCNVTNRSKSAATLGIDYRISDALYIGLSWTTGGKLSEIMNDNPNHYTNLKTSYKTNYLMLNCKYQWLRLGSMILYSRGGIGVGFTSDIKLWLSDLWANQPQNVVVMHKRGPSEKVAWQISPVGVEYKPLRFLGIFAEGGFGNQGNMLAGVRIYPL